jgi:heme-degrading monooxygenase HmoA
MHARVSTLQCDPAQIDEMAANLEESDLPEIRQNNGFKGFTLVVDRKSGKCVAISYWSSPEAMAASEEKVKAVRERAAQTGGATAPPEVEHFEVAIDVSS